MKTQAKYQQLIKEHSQMAHDHQLKDMQMQRLLVELAKQKEDSL